MTTPGDLRFSGALGALELRLRRVFSELAKFGAVGALSFVVDAVVFNAVLHATDKPLTSKVVSTLVAATNAFFLNRHWSFRHRERRGVHREYALFFVLNAIGLSISLTCLFVSHYLLGFDSRLADNISANGVGLVLGTTFRFWSYRRFLWLAPAAVDEAARDGDLAAAVVLDLERQGDTGPGR